MAPIVVGVDSSLTASGLAWPDGRCVSIGRSGITTIAYWGARGLTLKQLVVEVGRAILGLEGAVPGPVAAKDDAFWPPDLVALEGLELHSRSSGGLAERCYLWISLVNLLGMHGVPVLVVPPKTIKKFATSKGNASKAQVIDACARRLPQFETGGDENKADAAWACAIGLAMLGVPIVEVPATHRAALDTLTLPPLADGMEWVRGSEATYA
jgi:hypothetical protein